jgi:hypothetical protein
MPRLFTLQEAEALLPRLRELLPEMQEQSRRLARARAQVQNLTRAASGNGHLVGRELQRKRQEVDVLSTRLRELLVEIEQLGCELKGVEEGLIDFPAERDGRTVYLCWRLGEARIEHWHELDTGFAGRQPL